MGYMRGGLTALACKKDYPVYIDELAQICDVISVSAGIRGLQILLDLEDYIRAVKARVVPWGAPSARHTACITALNSSFLFLK
jgi:Cys-tRNA(Pro)/Cys-tRNA(Cys) deacylase